MNEDFDDEYPEPTTMSVLYDGRVAIAMDVLRLYPFRFNVQYDRPTQELIDVARSVIHRFLTVGEPGPGVAPG